MATCFDMLSVTNPASVGNVRSLLSTAEYSLRRFYFDLHAYQLRPLSKTLSGGKSGELRLEGLLHVLSVDSRESVFETEKLDVPSIGGFTSAELMTVSSLVSCSRRAADASGSSGFGIAFVR